MALLPLAALQAHRARSHGTPEAPAAARAALAALGPLSRARADRARRCSSAWWRSGRRRRRSSSIRPPSRFSASACCSSTGVLTLRRHREGGRRARDVHLVRGALHAEQPAERARIHGISRRSGWPVRWADCAAPTAGLAAGRRVRRCCTTCSSARRRTCSRCSACSSTSASSSAYRRAAGVSAAVRDELLLGDHAAGIEREPAVRRQRVSVAGRAVPARRDHHRVQLASSTSSSARLADARRAVT